MRGRRLTVKKPHLNLTTQNAVVTVGKAQGGKGGLGVFMPEVAVAYIQRCVDMEKIVTLSLGSGCNMVVNTDGVAYNQGGNGEVGAVGVGYPKFDIVDWHRVGDHDPEEPSSNPNQGRRLYREEILHEKNQPIENVLQPNGPYGPYFPTKTEKESRQKNGEPNAWCVAAVSTAAAHAGVLTTDGRVLCWGSGQRGDHGNGYDWKLATKHELAEAGLYAQYSPWWMQTKGPLQSEEGRTPSDSNWGDGTAGNIVTEVEMFDLCEDVTWLVKTDGNIYYAGQPAGGAEHVYVEKDPLWTWDGTPGHRIIALKGSPVGWVIILQDGTSRYGGNNREYMAGTGVLASKTTATRELLTPSTYDGTLTGKPAKNIVAVSCGVYSLKFLKSVSGDPKVDGTVHTSGSNRELQQGIAGMNNREMVEWVTQIPSMENLDGTVTPFTPVMALDGHSPEIVHGGPPDYGRAQGANGADMTVFLMGNRTVRTLGQQWNYNSGVGSSWESTSMTGVGDTQNRVLPTEPLGVNGDLGGLQNISQVACSCVHSMFVQDQALPGVRTMTAENVPGSPGTVVVEWSVPAQNTLGKWPHWHEDSAGWRVALEGIDGESGQTKGGPDYLAKNPYATGTTVPDIIPVGNPGAGTFLRKIIFTGVQRNKLYQARVSSLSGTQKPKIINSSGQREEFKTANVVTVPGATSFTTAVEPIPAPIVPGVFATLAKGMKKGETELETNVPAPLALQGGSFRILIDKEIMQVNSGQNTTKWKVTRKLEGTGEAAEHKLGSEISEKPVSAIKTSATPEAFWVGDMLLLKSGSHTQKIRVSENTKAGATVIPIAETEANFTYPIGSTLVRVEHQLEVKWEPIVGTEPGLIIEPRRTEYITPRTTIPIQLTGPTLDTTLTYENLPFTPALPPKTKMTGSAKIRISFIDGEGIEHFQFWEIGKTTVEGESVVNVVADEPNYPYPAGSNIVVAEIEDYKRVVPDLDPALGSAVIKVPISDRLRVGDEVQVKAVTTGSSSFKSRTTTLFVP